MYKRKVCYSARSVWSTHYSTCDCYTQKKNIPLGGSGSTYRGVVHRGKRRKKQNAHAIGVVVVEKGRVAAHTCVVDGRYRENRGGCVRVM